MQLASVTFKYKIGVYILAALACVAYGDDYKYEYKTPRGHAVSVNEDNTKVFLRVEAAAIQNIRSNTADAIHRGEARQFAITSLARYLRVPSHDTLNVSGLVLVSFSKEMGNYAALFSVPKAGLSASPSLGEISGTGQSSPNVRGPNDASEPLGAPAAPSQRGIPVVISDELSKKLPKLPGRISDAKSEWNDRAVGLMNEMKSSWAKSLSSASYEKTILDYSLDLDSLAEFICKEVMDDPRITILDKPRLTFEIKSLVERFKASLLEIEMR